MSPREVRLTEGEQVVLRLRTHIKALVGALLWAVLLVAALVGLWWVLRDTGAYVVGMWIAGGVALVLACWLVALPVVRWGTERYTITTRRIIHRHGILTRHGRDIPLHRVNDIATERDVIDRILGCGTLVVSDATEKAGMVLRDVPDVEQVHVQLQELLYTYDDGSDDGEWPPNEPRRR